MEFFVVAILFAKGILVILCLNVLENAGGGHKCPHSLLLLVPGPLVTHHMCYCSQLYLQSNATQGQGNSPGDSHKRK